MLGSSFGEIASRRPRRGWFARGAFHVQTNVAGSRELAPDLAPDRKELSGKKRHEVLKKVPKIRGR
jgi:hypothetical protein